MDIPDILTRLRNQRMKLVQTPVGLYQYTHMPLVYMYVYACFCMPSLSALIGGLACNQLNCVYMYLYRSSTCLYMRLYWSH